MEVIAYLGKTSPQGLRLEEAIRSAAGDRAVALCRNIGCLCERLQSSKIMETVVVLLASNRRALLKISSLRKHFDLFPHILIVPDAQRRTLSEAHRLNPRYVTLAGGDFADVEIVLSRLLRREEAALSSLERMESVKRGC